MRNSHTSLFDKRFIMAILLLFVFGCGQKTENEQKSQGGTLKPAGTIRVSGAWALYPMMVKWGEEYSKINPDMRIDISAGGAGKGIADALGGLVDIGMVSREIKPEEVKQGAFYVPVVKDAVFPTLNENNKAVDVIGKQGIKKKIFMDLWTNSKNVSWGVIAGTNSTDKIQVYTRSDSCGAAETWAQYLGGKKQEDLKGIGVYGDPGLAEAVKKDIYGVGYNNLNYAYDVKTGLPINGIKVISIDVNENGVLDPEEDISTKEKAIASIKKGVYPAPPARDLYLVVKEKYKEPAKSFVKWILNDGQKYVNEVGYIGLTEEQIQQAMKKLEQ